MLRAAPDRHRVIVVTEALDPVQTVADILAEHGPLAEDDIARLLRAAGVTDPDAVMDAALDEMRYPATMMTDDRWVWLPAVLAGRVFTHRLTAAEIDHDLLTLTPDLDPIAALCHHRSYQQLADGTPVQVAVADVDDALLRQRDVPPDAVDDTGALLLQPGTLAALDFAEGDLLGLRLDRPGLTVAKLSAATLAGAAEAGSRLAGMVHPDEPTYLTELVWTACAADPALFTEPVAPLRELADEHGLSRDGEWLAPAGFDWGRWYFQRGCAALAEHYALDDDEAFALYSLTHLYDEMALLVDATDPESLDEAVDLVSQLGIVLADPALATVFLDETTGTRHDGAAALRLFAEALEPKVAPAARVAFRWLRAVALERLGDIDGCQRELSAAEVMDPDWPLPLFDLARIASDRGDTETGLALLQRAGAGPDHPMVQLLQRHRPAPRRDLGRNDPCWCGSGRKYKKCHLGREQRPLAERVGWLYAKAIHHVLRPGWRDVLAEAGFMRGCYDDDHDTDATDPVLAAAADPLVVDAVLFEGGGFADFLALRGALLPDDERALAEQWLQQRRSVWEVEAVRPGHGVRVRDPRSGDVHEVRDRSAGRSLRTGQLVCARVAPVGDGMQFFGGIELVTPQQRDRLVALLAAEPDPVAVVAALSELSEQFAG